jgi:hypothetical protein
MGAVSLVQGVALFRARDYDGARRAFARAYEEEPSAGALFDLALAELQSGRSSDSVRHLRSYLTRSDAQADKLDAIRTRWLPQAEAHLARLEVQGTAGVEILVDGQSIGFTPSDDFELDGGQHSVVARKGSWSQEVTVVVRAGDFVAMRADVPELRALPEIGPAEGVTESNLARTITEVSLVSAGIAAAGGAIGYALAAGQATRPERARDSDLALGFALGATALGAGASVTWFAWPIAAHRGESARVQAVPEFDARKAGVAILGAF